MAAKKAPAKKAAAKKAPAKKAPAKKAPAKKAPAKKPAAKKAPAKKPAAKTAIANKYTKAQILTELAENSGLNRKQVDTVLEDLGVLIERHIKKRSCGEFTLPGLLKVKTVKKPARKARKGINPFTKEETIFKARPASTSIKVLALKKLKDMAN